MSEAEDQVEQPAEQEETPRGPKETPLFVSEPGEPSKRYARFVDPYTGKPTEQRDADSPEAAAHWDPRLWRR